MFNHPLIASLTNCMKSPLNWLCMPRRMFAYCMQQSGCISHWVCMSGLLSSHQVHVLKQSWLRTMHPSQRYTGVRSVYEAAAASVYFTGCVHIQAKRSASKFSHRDLAVQPNQMFSHISHWPTQQRLLPICRGALERALSGLYGALHNKMSCLLQQFNVPYHIFHFRMYMQTLRQGARLGTLIHMTPSAPGSEIA